MDISSFVADDEAVSSVVAVVLMVAVTIVLAAAVGTFVLGIASDVTQDYPNTAFDAEMYPDQSPGYVTITVSGGNPVETKTLTVTIGGDEVWKNSSCQNTGTYTCTKTWSGKLTSGDTLHVEEDTSSALKEGEILVVTWQSGGDSAILAERTL